MLGLSITLYRKFGSKELIEVLNRMETCSSYNQTMLFESSPVKNASKPDTGSSFVQFSFDNADHNTNTIDGLNTFHYVYGRNYVRHPRAICRNSKFYCEEKKKLSGKMNFQKLEWLKLKLTLNLPN